jgi:hypothetical protein
MSRADLFEANMSWADLSRADLSGANMSRANMSGANLSRADLSGANMSVANMSGADLFEADMSGANLDYSCWTFACKTLKAKIDKRIAVQLLYHTIAAMKSVDDDECKDFCKNKTVLKLANQFHRVAECGEL